MESFSDQATLYLNQKPICDLTVACEDCGEKEAFSFSGGYFCQRCADRYEQGEHYVHTLYADGIHDDTDALEAWINGYEVQWDGGLPVKDEITNKQFKISDYLRMTVYTKKTYQRYESLAYNILHNGPPLNDEELRELLVEYANKRAAAERFQSGTTSDD